LADFNTITILYNFVVAYFLGHAVCLAELQKFAYMLMVRWCSGYGSAFQPFCWN